MTLESSPNSNVSPDYEDKYRMIREALQKEYQALVDSGIDTDEAERIISDRVRLMIDNPGLEV